MPLLCCFVLTGCVANEQIGQVTHFSYDLWIQLLCPVATVSALVAGLRMRRASAMARLAPAWGLMTCSVIVGLPASAYFATASLTLSPEGYVERSFGSEKSRMQFDEMRVIEFQGQKSFAKKQRTNYILACQLLDGNYRNVAVSSLMKEGALMPILEKAQRRGVLVVAGREEKAQE